MASDDDMAFTTGFFESLHQRLPKERIVVETLGHLYTRQGRLTEGLKMDRKMVRLEPENPLAHYNLACSLALKERKKDAVASLETAVNLGYEDVAFMMKDPDLKALKGYNTFQVLLARLQGRLAD